MRLVNCEIMHSRNGGPDDRQADHEQHEPGNRRFFKSGHENTVIIQSIQSGLSDWYILTMMGNSGTPFIVPSGKRPSLWIVHIPRRLSASFNSGKGFDNRVMASGSGDSGVSCIHAMLSPHFRGFFFYADRKEKALCTMIFLSAALQEH